MLDLLTKTPVKAIHTYDGDRYIQHNAFRSPGAASIEALATVSQKVDYFAHLYRPMRRRTIPHDVYVTEDNVAELKTMSFVFLTLDDAPARKLLVTKLEEYGVPFIDVGIGLEAVDGSLLGQVRTTLSTPEQREHVHANHRIPFGKLGGLNDDYSTNTISPRPTCSTRAGRPQVAEARRLPDRS